MAIMAIVWNKQQNNCLTKRRKKMEKNECKLNIENNVKREQHDIVNWAEWGRLSDTMDDCLFVFAYVYVNKPQSTQY